MSFQRLSSVILLMLLLAFASQAQEQPESALAQLPPLQIEWEHSSYYALPQEFINLSTIVRNTGDIVIEDIVLTLNLPEGVTFQYENLFNSTVTLEKLEPGDVWRLAWPLVAAEDGEFTIQADIESGDMFFASLTDLNVGLRPPSIGYYSQGTFYLISGLGNGEVLKEITFGSVNARPLVGDWNGDGYTGLGVYENDTFYLINDVNPVEGEDVIPDLEVSFTNIGDAIPLVGDFNGNGSDSVMLYKDGVFYLRYYAASGEPDIVFEFGPKNADVIPLVGDWNGDGVDTIGVYLNGTFFLRNENSAGEADITVNYGPSVNAVPLVGDWNGDGAATLAVLVGRDLFLRDILSEGDADAVLTVSQDYFLPVVLIGYWQGADE